jgi:hypothetical protein
MFTLSVVDRRVKPLSGQASMFTSSVVDRRVKPLSGQTKDYKIGFWHNLHLFGIQEQEQGLVFSESHYKYKITMILLYFKQSLI